ncbi:MAG: adenylyl-sulfate kinase [Anaerolineae bacterium]|nr:adenylyl-sulfate kinase [Anaerolineae bacterium]NIN99201.1 adenylyl-sulfate kinase [Anaerolineae bacterium]NIQ82042.1 adenylyl-sulfate kinase [Anaerolineae bacterium]
MGKILWFYGEPATGKSTVSSALGWALNERGHSVAILESERVRKETGIWDFSPQGRDHHARYMAFIAMEMARGEYEFVLPALVHPSAESRQKARWIADRWGIPFIDIYMTCNEAALAARRSVREEFEYEKVPFEVPKSPNIKLDTGALSVGRCVEVLLEKVL